jgi:predicted porin
MKKTLIALAAVAVSGAAFAQSTVTLSGTFDPSYSKVTTTTAAGAKTNVTTLANGQQGTTAIKFSGTEDLGGGLKAIFMLEQNFDSTDGSNGAFATGEVAHEELMALNGYYHSLYTGGGGGDDK